MKYINILKYSALSLAAIAMWGCTKEVDYDPATAMTNAQIFFASNAASSFDISENQNSVTVEVSRVNTSGSLSVDVQASAVVEGASGYEETDIFTVPATATFADGAKTAPITISFDFNEIKPETEYVVTLDLEGSELSLYGKTQQEVSIMYAPWSEWEEMDGDGEYTNGSPFGFTDLVTVEQRNSLLNPNKVQYRIPQLYSDEPTLFEVDLATKLVTVPMQTTASSSGGFPIRMCDTFTFFTSIASGDPAPYEGLSNFNPETGLITVNMVYFTLKDGGGIGWWGDTNFDYLQLPGYPNYNMVMNNAGTYISEEGQEYTILSVTKGSDVASYAITLVQGYLDEDEIQAEVDAIIANTETVLYNESREFQFPVYEEDDYTCITVSYGSDGEPKGSNAYHFYNEMNGVDWNEGWSVVTENARFNDVFYAGLLVNGLYGWNVEVQSYDKVPGIYRIVKPYANNIYDMEVERGHYYVVIDATDPDAVTVEPSYTSFGYWVLSGATGKLVDGTKFVFPGGSLGVFQGYNADGTFKILSGWDEEATLLDLNPTAQGTRSAVEKKSTKLNKISVIPYTGKKIVKQPTTFIAK